MRDEEDFTISIFPLVFSAALYALEHCARLQVNQSILTHSAAGGVGRASIQVAQLIDTESFATVGDAVKRPFLIENFNIREDHWKACAESGDLIEIGKRDILASNRHRMVYANEFMMDYHIWEISIDTSQVFGGVQV